MKSILLNLQSSKPFLIRPRNSNKVISCNQYTMGICLSAQTQQRQKQDQEQQHRLCCQSICHANSHHDVIVYQMPTVGTEPKPNSVYLQEIANFPSFRQYLQVPVQIKTVTDPGQSTHRICVLFEPKYSDLSHQIEARRKSVPDVAYFTQPQIWYILYSLVQAVRTAQEAHLNMVGLKPEMVSIDSDGLVQIKYIPAELKHLEKQTIWPPEKTSETAMGRELVEVYRIGFIILVSATLTDWKTIYEQRKVKRTYLSSLLQQIGSQYSSYLYSTVYSMMASSPEDRKNLAQIYSILKPFEASIQNMRRFLPDRKNELRIKIQSQEGKGERLRIF